MDVSRFHTRGPEFAVLDLVASFRFRTAGSAGFALGRWGDGRPPADETNGQLGRGGTFHGAGSLEVHHPCDGHVQARLTVVLPEPYQAPGRMREIVDQVFAALGIPADETFEAHFVGPSRQAGMGRHRDRSGVSDCFEA